jgi:hypothetical protein
VLQLSEARRFNILLSRTVILLVPVLLIEGVGAYMPIGALDLSSSPHNLVGHFILHGLALGSLQTIFCGSDTRSFSGSKGRYVTLQARVKDDKLQRLGVSLNMSFTTVTKDFLGYSQSLRMAQSRNGGVSSFVLLCPELLNDIVEKVAKDDPASLKQLAKVNKAFMEAKQKCRRTLVIRGWLQNGAQKRERAAVERRQLSKELSERPKVSNLILTGEAPTSLLRVLSRIHWKSVTIGACGLNLPAVQCAQRLSGARSSLRTLVLTSSSIKAYKDIRCMVEFFPNLHFLTLRGMICLDRQLLSSPVGRSLQPDDINGNLERLDVFHLKLTFHSYSQLPRVLRCLKNLKSLETWAFEVFTEITLPDDHVHLSRLQCLHLEVFMQWPMDNFVLQSVANHCPSLEKFIIVSTRPYPETRSEEPLNILNLLDKCPNLERLFIS